MIEDGKVVSVRYTLRNELERWGSLTRRAPPPGRRHSGSRGMFSL
jgi:hypothetical protein